MFKTLGAIALMLASNTTQAGPELNIGAFYDYLEGPRSTFVKRLRNGGDATAFVKVEVVEEVHRPGQPALERALDGLPVADRPLIASPARLIVPAKGMQNVRLLYRGDRSKERYFRVRFMPVMPSSNDEFAITEQEAEHYRESLRAGVQVLSGYGALLFVQPQHTRYATHVGETSDRITVRNDGNATVVMDHYNDCDRYGKSCATATVHHVLPGLERHFEKKPGRTYSFELIEGQARRKVISEGQRL
jgi:P pilus assembly chaperone PapD